MAATHPSSVSRPPSGGLRRGASPARVALVERAAHMVFAGLALLSLVVILLITYFVFRQAWPAFRYNGPGIVTNAGPGIDTDLQRAFAGSHGQTWNSFHMWAAIYATMLTTIGATLFALPFSLFSAIFIAELAPRRLVALLEPAVRLLAAVPSVVFGLLALQTLAPFLANHVIDRHVAEVLSPVVTLSGRSLLLGIIVLFAMISPIMIAIFVDALRAVPVRWREGSYALGVDQWRTIMRIFLPVIRPAIVAGTILGMGRAIGEAIALSMAAGGVGFLPNPLDGFWFFLEPTHPLAATIVDFSEGLGTPALTHDLFACGAIIFISAFALSIAARLATLPLRAESTRA